MRQNTKQLPEALSAGISAGGGSPVLLCASGHHSDMGSTWAVSLPLQYLHVGPREQLQNQYTHKNFPLFYQISKCKLPFGYILARGFVETQPHVSLTYGIYRAISMGQSIFSP